MSFKQFFGKQDTVESVPSPASSLRKEAPTSLKSAPSFGTQRIPRLRARVTIAKTKQVKRRVHLLTKAKGMTRDVGAAPGAHCCSAGTFPLPIFAGVW